MGAARPVKNTVVYKGELWPLKRLAESKGFKYPTIYGRWRVLGFPSEADDSLFYPLAGYHDGRTAFKYSLDGVVMSMVAIAKACEVSVGLVTNRAKRYGPDLTRSQLRIDRPCKSLTETHKQRTASAPKAQAAKALTVRVDRSPGWLEHREEKRTIKPPPNNDQYRSMLRAHYGLK